MSRRLVIGAVLLLSALVLLTVVSWDVVHAHQVDRRTTASQYAAAGLTGASGKTMDHRSMASKWFAFGTRVMIVRPSGRHILMKVEDRCQCGADLDEQAARKIGYSGTAKVGMAKVHPGWRHENSWAARWIRR